MTTAKYFEDLETTCLAGSEIVPTPTYASLTYIWDEVASSEQKGCEIVKRDDVQSKIQRLDVTKISQ